MYWDGWLAHGSSGGWSSPAAAPRRPQGILFRRAGGSVRPTRRRVGSTGERRRARGTQAAKETRGAWCSSAVAMVVAAGLGVSREELTCLAFIGSRDA
jgi:hypothetical protein